MKKNIIAGLLSVAMLAAAPMSALAMNEAITLPPAIEVQEQKPTTIEATHIDAFLKKYGWDKKENGALTSADFAKDFAAAYFVGDDFKTIETLSKPLELRGWTSEESSTLYTAKKDYKTGDYNYQLVFAVFTDIKTGLVNAAVVKRLPTNLDVDKAASIYSMEKPAFATYEKDALAYAKANIFMPSNKIAQRSLIHGYKVSPGYNDGLKSFWKGRGWSSNNWTFYQNAVEEGHKAYLSGPEVNQAMKVSGEATGGVQVAMIMPSSGFYFAERSYKIKGTQNGFFIDFVASGINPAADSDKLGANFAFLIVKPAKVNMDGELEKFFYPTTAKLSTIAKDMNDYFNRDTSTPDGVVN